MADLLATSSLIITLITVFYSVWYPEMEKALDTKGSPHRADNEPKFREVSEVLRSRALPLACGTTLLTMVFVPDLVAVTIVSFRGYLTDFTRQLRSYDAVATAFSLVTCTLTYFSVRLWRLVLRLYQKKQELDPTQ